jgi:hypothetical protein
MRRASTGGICAGIGLAAAGGTAATGAAGGDGFLQPIERAKEPSSNAIVSLFMNVRP